MPTTSIDSRGCGRNDDDDDAVLALAFKPRCKQCTRHLLDDAYGVDHACIDLTCCQIVCTSLLPPARAKNIPTIQRCSGSCCHTCTMLANDLSLHKFR